MLKVPPATLAHTRKILHESEVLSAGKELSTEVVAVRALKIAKK